MHGDMSPSFDAREFRAALGTFATGVTVITTRAADGTPVGLTASSFNSVSIDPPMVLWSLAKKANSLPVFQEAIDWAVHVLAANQEPLANRFSRAGEDKFSGLALENGVGRVPLLAGCAARFQCKTSFRYEGGDHIIFVGEVSSFERGEHPPLVFHAGGYAMATRKAPIALFDAQSPHGFSEDLLGYLLARGYFQFHQGLRGALRAQGLSDSEWYVVAFLATKDGATTARDIEESVQPCLESAAEPILQHLIQSGWVETKWDGGQGIDVFGLTSRGRDQSLHLLAAAKAIEIDRFDRLGYADGATLKILLRKFMALG